MDDVLIERMLVQHWWEHQNFLIYYTVLPLCQPALKVIYPLTKIVVVWFRCWFWCIKRVETYRVIWTYTWLTMKHIFSFGRLLRFVMWSLLCYFNCQALSTFLDYRFTCLELQLEIWKDQESRYLPQPWQDGSKHQGFKTNTKIWFLVPENIKNLISLRVSTFLNHPIFFLKCKKIK